MKPPYSSHRLFDTEQARARAADRAALESARQFAEQEIAQLRSVLPETLKSLARDILAVQSAIPLWHEVNGTRRINSVEFTTRMMRVRDVERSAPAVQGFAFEFRPSNSKGGPKLKQPTPGRRSGAQKGSL